ELATFEPCPRFALFTLPKASPTSRRRGVSGKGSPVGPPTDANDLAVAQGRLGPWSSFEAARFEVLQRLDTADLPHFHEEGRGDQEAVAEPGQEQRLDVLGHDVVASVQQRPAARRALEREAATDGRPDRDDVEPACGTDELDDPALEDLVDVYLFARVLEGRHLLDSDD